MEVKHYTVADFIRGSLYWSRSQTEDVKYCKTADNVCHVIVSNTDQLNRAMDLITDSDVWIYVPQSRSALQNKAKKLGFESLNEEPILSASYVALMYETERSDDE